MVIEILFNESCNLYGDGQNVRYLEATLPNAQFIFTKITDTPYFVNNDPDMIYIGSMSESVQRRVIETLKPYKKRILDLIKKNIIILATGNAGEIFCKEIHYITEEITTEALEIFDINVETNLFDRYNGKVLADLNGFKLVGFRSQFSLMYGNNEDCFFVKTDRGIGINRNTNLEGLRKNNLICTQILGPVLPLNPLFTEYLLSICGENLPAAFRTEAMDAYEQRLKEFSDPVVPC